ncbi:S8 family serine peptidase [uncultured Clostridium sp.]|uniref:S8 family peptidase n=1 Tax=uncultured Clostridium sp. TaxID=59620 RepID=UPI0025CFD717|nr:S8 family serine peptidase [uncultured Clostridium sp.]
MNADKIYIETKEVNKAYIGNTKIKLSSTNASQNDNYIIKTNKSGNFTIKLASSFTKSDVTIDFGNGKIMTASIDSSLRSFSTNYTDSSEKLISISNSSIISSLYCNNMNISELRLNTLQNLEKLVCYNNNIASLDFSNNSIIQFIHCFSNPIIDNDTSLTAMIKSLPDRNNKAYGSLIIDNTVQRLKMESISIQKDWLFGSAIMYNEKEWAKCGYHFKQTGVADIWESAERGDGVTIAIIDVGFDLNCIEYDKSRIIETKNFSNHGRSNEVPIPTSGTITHGNSTSCILMAKGINMYGICPNASFRLYKACDDKSVAYSNWVSSALNYCKSKKVNIVSMSLSFRSSYTNLYNSVKNLCLPGIFSFYKGIPLVCSNYNIGDNNSGTDEVSYPGFYKYPISMGSLKSNNELSNSSPSYNGIDFVTYGKSIYTQKAYNAYGNFSGTSASTPLAAGIATLLINIFYKKNKYYPSEKELYLELCKRTIPMNIDSKSCGVGRLMLTSYNENPTKIEHT